MRMLVDEALPTSMLRLRHRLIAPYPPRDQMISVAASCKPLLELPLSSATRDCNLRAERANGTLGPAMR